jgi:hypothetical protein
MDFKRQFAARLLQAGTAIEKALSLDSGRGATLLMRTFALTRGLWPAAECPALRETQALPHPDFATELEEALTDYWRGALTARPPGLSPGPNPENPQPDDEERR